MPLPWLFPLSSSTIGSFSGDFFSPFFLGTGRAASTFLLFTISKLQDDSAIRSIHLPAMVNDVAISNITILPKHYITLGKMQRFKPGRNGFTLRQRCCTVALLQNHWDSSPYLSSFRLEPLLPAPSPRLPSLQHHSAFPPALEPPLLRHKLLHLPATFQSLFNHKNHDPKFKGAGQGHSLHRFPSPTTDFTPHFYLIVSPSSWMRSLQAVYFHFMVYTVFWSVWKL